jgi:dTDP-glucose pyrophosphorylase
MTDFRNNLIYHDQLMKEALEKLNTVPEGLTLFVVDEEERLVGTLTDGDIRRGLLSGKTISSEVSEFMFRNFRFLQRNNYTLAELDELKKKRIKLLPILDHNKRIHRVIDLNRIVSLLPVDAVIMAGGRGERLKPLTDSVPKPLLVVGDKPIIEHNIDRLISYGIDTIHVSVRYLGSMLKDYFGDGSNKKITISYVEEEEPLGTLGAVSLIREYHHDYILLMNSDLLTNIDFEDFFRSYIEAGADMAVASIPYQVNIPYAVLDIDGDHISSFQEKPTYTYYSSGGIYLIKKSILLDIPTNSYYNATDLMEDLIKQGGKVIHFPLLGYWLDIGKHEDYKKAQEDIKHIKL